MNPESGHSAAVVGGEEDDARIRGPDRIGRPEIEPGRQRSTGRHARQVGQPEHRFGRQVGVAVGRSDGYDPPSVRRDARLVEFAVEMLERPARPGLDVERDEIGRRRGRFRPIGPAGHDRSAVRRKVEFGLHEDGPGIARDVDRLEAGGGVGGRVGIDRQRRREEALALRREPVIPVSNRVLFEQQGADAGILPSLRPRSVVLEAGRERVDEHAECDRVRVPRGGHGANPALGREQQPRLAAVRRQHPERIDLMIRVRLGVRVGSARGEQERAVAGERGVRLPGRARGQPARVGPAGRVDLPDRPPHRLAVRGLAAHRHHKAASVGREAQARQPRGVEEAVERQRLIHARNHRAFAVSRIAWNRPNLAIRKWG